MAIAKLKNNLNMYYEIHGEGEPLILINGLKSDHTGWVPLLDSLRKHFQVIILDNRAVGQTKDNGDFFTIEDMAFDIIQLMDMLTISSAHIAGHSMGGAVAQVIAHQYADRVKKVFLCNTFMKINEVPNKTFNDVLTLFRQGSSREDIMDAILPWVFSSSFNTPELRAQIHSFVAVDPFWQSPEDYERQLHALGSFDSSLWAKEITVPTVVVGSHEDRTALPEESIALANSIAAAQLEMLDGGHASAIEQPAAFYKLFAKHLTV